MKQITLLIAIGFIFTTACAQRNNQERSIAFYNVENLFDTLDTPNKDDKEFLPESKRNWNSDRYTEKLAHINKVFGELNNPLVIGVCEIENRQVVQDIVDYGAMINRYAVVHSESLDNRGIDNAIIYDSITLTLVESGIVRFDMPEGSGPSRDIVWAKFKKKRETFYVMVNHWPSRRGGQEKSEPKRLIAAESAREFINEILANDKKAQIVFMGDLNDYPTNKAPQMIGEILEPMITPKSGEFGGTHNYRGEWNVLDHIMVSSSFKKKKGMQVLEESGQIHSPEYLITTYKGNLVPFRTYGGGKYLGGYSDHLPVSIQVEL